MTLLLSVKCREKRRGLLERSFFPRQGSSTRKTSAALRPIPGREEQTREEMQERQEREEEEEEGERGAEEKRKKFYWQGWSSERRGF